MEVKIVMTVSYDREKDGPLADFGDKYHTLKDHVEHLQAKGQLPREPIKWKLEIHKPPITPPPQGGPARILNGPWLARPEDRLIIVHQQGTPLQLAG